MHLHLLQLVPDGLHVSSPVISLQVVDLHVVEALLQFFEGATQLREETSGNQLILTTFFSSSLICFVYKTVDDHIFCPSH